MGNILSVSVVALGTGRYLIKKEYLQNREDVATVSGVELLLTSLILNCLFRLRDLHLDCWLRLKK